MEERDSVAFYRLERVSEFGRRPLPGPANPPFATSQNWAQPPANPSEMGVVQ